MGKLVQFEIRGKAGDTPKPAGEAGGEVLIFTGVRYERQTSVDNTPTKPSASSGGKRKRG